MLRSRNSGGRLVRSTPRQNTRSAPRPRSMRAGGALKSTPRKFGTGGWSCTSDGQCDVHCACFGGGACRGGRCGCDCKGDAPPVPD